MLSGMNWPYKSGNMIIMIFIIVWWLDYNIKPYFSFFFLILVVEKLETA